MILTAYYLLAGGSILLACLICAIIVRSQSSSTDCPSDSFLLQSRSSLEGEPWWERAAVARRMSIDANVNTCRVCQKQTTTQCSHCKSVKYCGPVCQRKDWGSGHKFECLNLKNLRSNAAKAAAAGNSKPTFLDPNEDAPVPQQVLFSYELFLQLRKAPSSCRRAPVGLINHGNNCYANAALQCLLYTKPLRAYLDQGLHSKDCNRPHDRDWCLLCVLSRLCHEMSHAPMHAEMSLKPLLRHLRRFAKTMSYGRQEDAHEFFYSVLNTMEAIQLANLGGKERFDMRSQETTLVHHVFGGYLRSQVVCCGCGAASRRYEAALDLQLEVPAGVDRLEDVLQRHTAEEVLDGDNCYACDGCKQRCRANRSTRFEVAPNTLVLCLKRFGTGRFGKINKVLVYGEKLDLGPFMAAGAMDDVPATYTLTGVVVHLDQMNSTSFGHYISFVRSWDGNSSSGQWYACDDSRVCRTRASDVLSQNAYMLFYQRDTPKVAPQPGYVRPAPLLPLTAARQAAMAAAAAAAAAPTTPKAQEAVKVANGVAAAAAGAAAAAAVPDTQQLDQQREAAEVAGAAVHEEQQQQQQQQQPLLAAMRSQPPPAQPDSGELLPRIATAPAALALLAGRAGSSSRDEDDSGSHATTSSACLADLSACSTPSYHGNGTAAAADGWGSGGHAHGSNGSSADSSSSGRPPGRQSMEQQGAAGGVKVPPHTLRRRRQQQQRQQQAEAQAGAAAAGEQAVLGTAGKAVLAGVGSGSSSEGGSLPTIQHSVVAGPELLQVRLELPGVTTAAEVQVSLEPPSEQQQQQCLWLQVPGRFAELQLPLGPHLQPGQSVGAVSGRFYRKQQQLKLKLRLAAAGDAAAAAVAGEDGSGSSMVGGNGGSGSSNAASGQHSGSSSSTVRQSLDFHLTDGFDTSSGSESEGYQQQQRQAGSTQGRAGGMHAVASERDLCSIFGRHSATVAHQLMQQLQKQRGAGQDGAGEAGAGAAGGGAAAALAAGGKKAGGAKKKAPGKKKGKKK